MMILTQPWMPARPFLLLEPRHQRRRHLDVRVRGPDFPVERAPVTPRGVGLDYLEGTVEPEGEARALERRLDGLGHLRVAAVLTHPALARLLLQARRGVDAAERHQHRRPLVDHLQL